MCRFKLGQHFLWPFLYFYTYNAASPSLVTCGQNVDLLSKHRTQSRSLQWPSFHTLNKLLSFFSTHVGLARVSPGTKKGGMEKKRVQREG